MHNEIFIVELREMGLLIYDDSSFPEEHFSFPNGLPIYKPVGTEGNGSNLCEIAAAPPHTEDEEFFEWCNIPSVVVCQRDGNWLVIFSEGYAPGPGPADFTDSFEHEADAVASVKSFFFDPNDTRFLKWKPIFEAAMSF